MRSSYVIVARFQHPERAGGIAGVDPGPKDGERGGPIGGTGIEVGNLERIGHTSGHRALSDAPRAVYRDDHTRSISSKNPGQDTAAVSAPSIRTGPVAPLAATAAHIAMR